MSAEDGILYQVIGTTIRPSDGKVDLRLARRTVIEAVPEIWTRNNDVIDDSQLEYVLHPPNVVEPIDLTPEPVIDSDSGSIDANGNYRLRYVKMRKRVVHPDVLLWVPFTDGTAVDISSYQHTLTANHTQGTVTTSGIRFYASDPTGSTSWGTQELKYGPDANLNWAAGDPRTMEGFITYVDSENNTEPGVIFAWDDGTPVHRRFSLYGGPIADCWVEHIDTIKRADSGAAVFVGNGGVRLHWAWVKPTGTGAQTERWYINGVQVMTFSVNRSALTDNSSYLRIGGGIQTNGVVGGLPGIIDYTLGETRVVKRNLYPSGTTFTPPTMGNLPAIT